MRLSCCVSFACTGNRDLGFPAAEYLTFRLRVTEGVSESLSANAGQISPADRIDYQRVHQLIERLEAEPSVEGVTIAARIPGTYHDWRGIELDDGGEARGRDLDEKAVPRSFSVGRVTPNFFDVLGVEAIQGRAFNAGDADPESRTVVVNQLFVEKMLRGRNPIGRQLRHRGFEEGWDGVQAADAQRPWYQIVGVVPNLDMDGAGFYHAVSPERLAASNFLVHVDVAAVTFATRMHEIAADVDPYLALVSVQSLDRVNDQALRENTFWFRMIIGGSGLAVLLSLASIYAVMSFSVSRRIREIGVRVALGADPARVASAIFRRPLTQVASGLLIGSSLSVLLSASFYTTAGLWGMRLVLLCAYAALMTMVCLIACIVPMRKALRVEPHQALTAEG